MGSNQLSYQRLINTGFAILGGLCAVVVGIGLYSSPGRSPASTKPAPLITSGVEARLALPVLD
jgi:hypothetical protein